MTRGAIALFVFVAGATVSFADEIYTWTDANGITHFSGAPPATQENAETIIVEPTPAAADPAKAHAQRMRQLNLQLEAIRALRSTQNPIRGTSSRSAAAGHGMSDQEYQQAKQAIRSAWQRKEIGKAREGALYLDLERKRFGLSSNQSELAKTIMSSGQITGPARTIDGDTLDIGDTRIRLYGIDAVEKSQLCSGAFRQWPCGQQATSALTDRIGTSTIECRSRDRDKNDRIVAVCYAGREDLNAWMVSEGWAVAYTRYSSDYVEQEKEARTFKRNIWSGEFVTPETYRHQ